ncbi:hypothetical protein WA026_003222 [Henosepilachna vigintioctopunctata]|uniref:Uncharacterized protein n=1 Tax=Henosepilachna vigintioctopunctata TaxID=420089 RepID=A0AAW1TMF5_9CUCU
MQLEEANEAIISLKEDNELIKTQIADANSELDEAKANLILSEERNAQTLKELEDLKKTIEEMDQVNKELTTKYDSKDKEMCNKINQMKFERDQLVNMTTEYANMTESSRQQVLIVEKKLTQLTIEKENLENKLRKEYENNLQQKLKDCEREFTDRLLEIESKTHTEVEELSAKILELSREYADNYVKKSQVEEKVSEMSSLKSELETLKQSFNDCKQSVERSGNVEKKMKAEINNLQTKLNQLTLQYSHAVLEKSSLEQKLNEVNNKRFELEAEFNDEQRELLRLKEYYQKEIQLLEGYKSKLELKVSELEFSNADLHHRLARVQADTGDHLCSTSLPINPSQNGEIGSRPEQINQVSHYARQISNSSQSCMSEDEVRTRGVFSIVVPQKSEDSDRIEANSSPDLGIESDQGRFSSLEVQTQVPRPLLPTIQIAESMNNLLDADNNSVQESECGNKSCYQKSIELTQENNLLKRKLLKTKKALEDTVAQLTIANQRKKQVERNICRQIHKTSQVLREAKANLDSGSETDFHKK